MLPFGRSATVADRQSVELEAMVEKAARTAFAVAHGKIQALHRDIVWHTLEAAGVPELLEREQRLRDALRPFAALMDQAVLHGHGPGSSDLRRIAFDDIEAARAALAEVSNTDNEGGADHG